MLIIRIFKLFKKQAISFVCIYIAMSSWVFAEDSEGIAVLPELTIEASKQGTTTFNTHTNVSVIKGSDIEKLNFKNLDGIAIREPNIYFTNFTNSTPTLTIRGLGFSDDESDSISNGVYIDGIPIYSQALGQMFDLQQVEILRGPQSTLYGQSSIGGVVALRTQDPGFTNEGSARVDFGTGNRMRLNVAGDTVLDEHTALRLVLGGESSDGHVSNTNLDRDDTAGWDSLFGRMKLLHEDEAGGILRVALHHMKLDSGNDFFTSPELAKEHESTANESGKTNNEYKMISGDYQRSLENGIKLTAVLGANTTRWEYQMPTSIFGGESGFRSADGKIDALETKQLSAEFRLAHSASHSDWLAGVYVAQQDRTAPFQFDLRPAFLVETRADIEGSTLAIFGEYGRRFADAWRVAGALRLEKNRRRMNWRSRQAGFFDSDGDGIPDTAFDTVENLKAVKADDSEVLPRLILEYTPDEQRFGWMKFERGYKASGFNLFLSDPELADQAYEPEYGNYIELGYRLRDTDRLWEVEVTVFNMNLEDQQVVTLDSQGRTLTDNAAESHSRGVELSGSIKLSSSLTLSGYVGFVEAEYDEYTRGGTVDLSGEQFANSPKNSYGVTVNWMPAQRWETTIGASHKSESSLFPDITTETDGFTLIDAHVAYHDGLWSYGLYGKNLLDENYLVRGLSSSQVVAGDPLTLGVYASVDF